MSFSQFGNGSCTLAN